MLLMATTAVATFATRPLRIVYAHQQQDGTRVTVTRAGNAFLNFYLTEDGVPLLPDPAGNLCYAELRDGALIPTRTPAHNASSRTADEQALAARLLEQAPELEALQARRTRSALGLDALASTANGLGAYGTSGGGAVNSIGTPVIPVIMVDFPDLAFQDTTTVEKVSRIFNEEGYRDENYCVGSIRDYFRDQSNGLFAPTFKVVGKVTASKAFANYGNNKGTSAVRTLVSEALAAAAAQGVDFSEFADATGSVPLVSIYYAGVGAHSCYDSDKDDHIWAHYSTISTATVGGVRVKSYFVGNELLREYRRTPSGALEAVRSMTDGIGVFCHEFGHALGLPDFYYTGSSTAISDTLLSMDYWSVMDYGQYYANGYRPLGYNAYERALLGWQRVTMLAPGVDDGYHSLYRFADESKENVSCYGITNPANAKEYFLMECRIPGKWYPSNMGSGLLMLHIDYDATSWSGNRVNNDPARQRVTYVPADGQKQGVVSNALFSECADDLFGGKSGVKEFSPETMGKWAAYATPATSTTYAAPLYDIALSGNIVSFCFNDKSQVTGIGSVKVPACGNAAKDWFTLDGRRTTTPAKPGIYLNGGQKVLVR